LRADAPLAPSGVAGLTPAQAFGLLRQRKAGVSPGAAPVYTSHGDSHGGAPALPVATAGAQAAAQARHATEDEADVPWLASLAHEASGTPAPVELEEGVSETASVSGQQGSSSQFSAADGKGESGWTADSAAEPSETPALASCSVGGGNLDEPADMHAWIHATYGDDEGLGFKHSHAPAGSPARDREGKADEDPCGQGGKIAGARAAAPAAVCPPGSAAIAKGSRCWYSVRTHERASEEREEVEVEVVAVDASLRPPSYSILVGLLLLRALDGHLLSWLFCVELLSWLVGACCRAPSF